MYLVRYSYRWPDKTKDSGFSGVTVIRPVQALTGDYCKKLIEEHHAKFKGHEIIDYYEFVEGI